jgi:DDE superfamily endonuclease
MDSLQDGAADVESLAVLSRFRRDFHACLTARGDELCELADAVLCADRPVRSLAGLPLPRAADGRLMLAVDVSNWLRPDAVTSPERLFCHVHGRARGQAQMIPGWPYPVIAALEPGRTSWTAVLDAVRLGPDDDDIAVTAAQVRDVITRLIAAGRWRHGDPAILVVFAGVAVVLSHRPGR